MLLTEIVKTLDLGIAAGEDLLDREVRGGYASDMLSMVIASAKKDDIWLTIQVHPNIVAVAVLKELAGIVMVGGKKPAEETLAKARNEGIVILTSPLPAYELAGKLYAAGLRGTD